MAGDSLSSSEIDGKLQKLETKLDNLRRDYEQFFVGARDRPPRNTRKQVDKLVRDLEQASVTNTSQKFRLRGLVQRYNSYKQKWNRVQRQIEEGTYKPHQDRAERRMEGKGGGEREDQNDGGEQQQQDDDVVELDVEMEGVDLGDLEKELQEMDQAGEFDKYDKGEQQQKRRDSQQDGDQARRRPPESSSNQPDRNPPQSDRPGGDGDAPQSRDADEDKLREIQNKLGISGSSDRSGSGGSGEDKREKLKSMRQKLGGNRSNDGGNGSGQQPRQRDSGAGGSQAPTGGAKREDLEKLRRGKDSKNKNRSNPDPSNEPKRKKTQKSDRESNRSDSGRQDRVIERSSNRRSSRRSSSDDESDDDDESHAAYLYDHLVATKREYGEPTARLTFEAVRESMHRQCDRLIEERGVRDVDFRVVIKDEQVYLQPVPLE